MPKRPGRLAARVAGVALLTSLLGCSTNPGSNAKSPQPPAGQSPTSSVSPGSPTSPTPSSGSTPWIWMISPGHLHTLELGGMSSQLAASVFDNPNTYFNLGANGAQVTEADVAEQKSAFPHANVNWLFNSFDTNSVTGAPGIDALLTSSHIPAGLTSVQYDPESGQRNGTPEAEQQALEDGNLTYVKQAATLVHAHGLRFIFSPSVDVGMTASEASYPTKYTTYISQDRGAWAGAGDIDIFAIQSQQAEGTRYFDSFLTAAMAQARKAAPRVVILIGIGINPKNPPTAVTTQDLLAAYHEASVIGANGFWNNVETGTGANVPTSVYVSFFQTLSDGGASP